MSHSPWRNDCTEKYIERSCSGVCVDWKPFKVQMLVKMQSLNTRLTKKMFVNESTRLEMIVSQTLRIFEEY